MIDQVTLDSLAARLEGAQLRPGRWRRGGLIACCPCHPDTRPSLSIDLAPDGRLLARCWAGCEQTAVAVALGLARPPTDWSPPPLAPRPRQQPKPRPTAPPAAIVRSIRYEVRDAAGVLVAVHHRLDLADGSKRIWWSQPDGQRGLDRLVTDLPLYGAERVVRLPISMAVVVAEGEKATHALMAAGLLAVGSVCGASATPGSEALAVLASREVVLWPDADQPGRQHMDQIAHALADTAASIRMVEPPPDAPKGFDAADATAEERLTLVAGARLWVPPVAHCSGERPSPAALGRLRLRRVAPALKTKEPRYAGA